MKTVEGFQVFLAKMVVLEPDTEDRCSLSTLLHSVNTVYSV